MSRRVGPVLVAGDESSALLRAIENENSDVVVVDRGGYLRVSAPSPCVVTRAALASTTGGPVSLRDTLTRAMMSFSGRLELEEESARWL